MDKQKRILIVEDDQFLREFYHDLLIDEGFLVEAAPDGEIGEQKLLEGGFDLTLLDIMLPKKDGVHILEDYKKSHPQKPNGPIVVLTNLGQDSVIKSCFDLGAAGYLIKSSLDPDQVVAEVKNYLQSNHHEQVQKL